jgi:Fibrobacter succinogenes major domain (Fib_succ_major)
MKYAKTPSLGQYSNLLLASVLSSTLWGCGDDGAVGDTQVDAGEADAAAVGDAGAVATGETTSSEPASPTATTDQDVDSLTVAPNDESSTNGATSTEEIATSNSGPTGPVDETSVPGASTTSSATEDTLDTSAPEVDSTRAESTRAESTEQAESTDSWVGTSASSLELTSLPVGETSVAGADSTAVPETSTPTMSEPDASEPDASAPDASASVEVSTTAATDTSASATPIGWTIPLDGTLADGGTDASTTGSSITDLSSDVLDAGAPVNPSATDSGDDTELTTEAVDGSLLPSDAGAGDPTTDPTTDPSSQVDSGEGAYFEDPRDLQRYPLSELGGLQWFAINLNYEVSNSWCYDDSPSNCETYGRLYTQEAISCPVGWRVPTEAELLSRGEWVGTSQLGGYKGNGAYPWAWDELAIRGYWWAAETGRALYTPQGGGPLSAYSINVVAFSARCVREVP